MLSQEMIAKFPDAYQKLARQHDSAELNLIMGMAKLYYKLLIPLEVDAVTKPIVETGVKFTLPCPKLVLISKTQDEELYEDCTLAEGHLGNCISPSIESLTRCTGKNKHGFECLKPITHEGDCDSIPF